MRTYQFVISIFLISILTGCSSSKGFNRGALRKEISEKPEVTDAEIKKTLALKPQLPRPFKLGIYFKEPVKDNLYYHHHQTVDWNWTEKDKQKILSIKDEPQFQNEISEIILINSSIVGGTDLKSLRLAAAQHGADALLIVSGAKQIDRYHNRWGWTYIGLVTVLFIPASELDVLFLSQASMWDVRNQYLYLTAESESLKKQTRPAAFLNEKKLIKASKEESINQLRNEILKMLAQAGQKLEKVKK